MDYEKIAVAAVQAMTTANLHRFLVVCALVSDLYCPGYNPKQPLANDSNLSRAAARYKVHTPKITAAVRTEELRKKSTSQTKSTSSENSENTSPQNRKRVTQKKRK